jgi:hypothetical protein
MEPQGSLPAQGTGNKFSLNLKLENLIKFRVLVAYTFGSQQQI